MGVISSMAFGKREKSQVFFAVKPLFKGVNMQKNTFYVFWGQKSCKIAYFKA